MIIFSVYRSEFCKERIMDLDMMPLDDFLELKEQVDIQEALQAAYMKDNEQKT